MKKEKLARKSLTQLLELKSATESVCEDYAKELTDYATMNGDLQFKNMPANTQVLYEKRLKFLELLNTLKSIIEEKLMNYYDE